MLRAVTFDFWNTLVYEPAGLLRGRRLDAWSGLLEDAGFACERQRLDAVFDTSWERFQSSWKAGAQYQAVRAAEEILEELGFDVDPALRSLLLAAFTEAGHEAELRLTGNIEACLRAMKEAGVRLGIVCDVGMTASVALRGHLEKAGLLELFDHWSFSDEVGFYKPAPEIFEHALAGLGSPSPETVAHVGDLKRTDIAGALAMGMIAVRYTGVFDDDTQTEPEGHHVVADHADLPSVLGVA